MATELLRPGVSVIQEFRTVSPTVATPTLVPCAVGPAYQVLEALKTDATGNSVINSQAIATIGATLTARNSGTYAGLDGKVLKVSVNGGPVQEFVFSDPTGTGLTALQCADQINGAATAPSGFGAYAVGTGSTTYLQLRATSKGDGQTLKILPGSANSVLGFLDNEISEGASTYKQTKLRIEQNMLPDPRGIIDELDIDERSIRVFVSVGSRLKEFNRTQTFLRQKKVCAYVGATITFPLSLGDKWFSFKEGLNGTVVSYKFETGASASNIDSLVQLMNTLVGDNRFSASGSDKLKFTSAEGYIEIVTPSNTPSAHSLIGWTDGDKTYTLMAADDGDGDNKTPFVTVPLDNFSAPAGSASLTGTQAITDPINVHNKTFVCSLDGAREQEVVFDGGPIVPGDAFNTDNTLSGDSITLSVNGATKVVTFSGTDPIPIGDVITQINTAAGTTVAYQSTNTGVPSPAGDRIAFQVGGGTPIQGGSISITAGTGSALEDLGFGASPNLPIEQTSTLADIVSQLNATFGPSFAEAAGSYLKIKSSSKGEESKLGIKNGTANSQLGFTDGQVSNGSPFPVYVGDAVWGDGNLVGYVVQVAPGGDTTMLKLDREVPLTSGVAAVYIEAMNLDKTPLATDRPTPDLLVDLSGAIVVKHDLLRDTEGTPISASGPLLISYKALRLDVSTAAKHPSLLTISDVTTLSDALGPVNADNPLALQLYFMLINATGISVTGIGVPGVSEAYPDGTPEAYAEVCNFLEAQEVYALAPTSQDETVHQLFATHVSAMSEPDNKGERIVFICPKMPKEALPKLVVSGTDGDSTPTPNEFDTKIPSLATDLLAAGVNPVGTIPASAGVFLSIAGSTKKYNISSVSGTKVSIRTAFAPGENDDDFYAEENLPSSLVSATFSVKVRGTSLVDSEGKPNYAGIAQAYQDLARAYGNRRVILVAPEKVSASIEGSAQKLPGYYLCGAIAGMVGRLPPQQGFTNYPIAGFIGVSGSNDVFNESQLNTGAAGGVYWVVQDAAGAPLSCRHQLTTDLTSIETRELSVTKVVDFVAKFMRSGLRNFIGRFNVTQSFLDTLSTVVQGQLGFLAESGVIIGGDLNNIVQDEKAPDTVLIDVTLDVPYPCNYIRLTLVI